MYNNSEIYLNPINLNSAPYIFELVDSNRNYLRRWLPWVDNTLMIEDTSDFIRFETGDDFYSKRLVFEIWIGKNLCGLIDVHDGDFRMKSAEIGYWLAEEFQGRGIVTAACRKLFLLLFDEYGLELIKIKCAEGNYKSQNVPKRLHFKLENKSNETAVIRGKEYKLIIFSMTKENFNKFRKGGDYAERDFN